MIRFFSENISFKLKKKTNLKKWLLDVFELEKAKAKDINFILCDDNYLLDINKKYLNHNYYTDIITFDTSLEDDKHISGDIFISLDMVKENAENYKTGFENEILRMLIHGILHLLGYKDKDEKNKKIMTLKEDFYINLYVSKYI